MPSLHQAISWVSGTYDKQDNPSLAIMELYEEHTEMSIILLLPLQETLNYRLQTFSQPNSDTHINNVKSAGLSC